MALVHYSSFQVAKSTTIWCMAQSSYIIRPHLHHSPIQPPHDSLILNPITAAMADEYSQCKIFPRCVYALSPVDCIYGCSIDRVAE
jgi:hypothetical protein